MTLNELSAALLLPNPRNFHEFGAALAAEVNEPELYVTAEAYDVCIDSRSSRSTEIVGTDTLHNIRIVREHHGSTESVQILHEESAFLQLYFLLQSQNSESFWKKANALAGSAVMLGLMKQYSEQRGLDYSALKNSLRLAVAALDNSQDVMAQCVSIVIAALQLLASTETVHETSSLLSARVQEMIP